MLKGLVDRLRGQVQLRVESERPERVLNLCAQRRLELRSVRWESERVFSCVLSRHDFLVLRLLSRKLDCALQVRRRQGAPFALGRLRRRGALAAGLLAGAAALFFSSFFIWDITVDGAQTVPEETILRALEKNGVAFGAFGFSIDGEDLRNHVLLDLPELKWLTVNVSGWRAYVQVRERTPAPELIDRRAPCNVTARRDGMILRVQAFLGKKYVQPGDMVEQGQLLISGVEDLDTFGARITTAYGSVTARTWYRLSALVPLRVTEKSSADDPEVRWSLILGRRRIKLYGSSSYFGAVYDKITERNQLALFGLPLPAAVEKETYLPFTPRERTRSPAEAEAAGRAALTQQLLLLTGPDCTVRSTLVSSRMADGALRVTLTAECEEEIGQTTPLEADAE